MQSSGYNGVPDFYPNGRSISIAAAMNGHNPSQNNPFHRSQLPGLFLDPTASQIARQTQFQPQTQNPAAGLIGKRTLAEFQAQQQNHYNPHQNPSQNLYLRSLKARTFQHSSPISPLSPIDFSSGSSLSGSESSFSSTSILPHQRFGLPMLQQLRPQPINQPAPQAMSYVNNLVPNNPVQTRGVDSEKMFSNRLQELEKQLLDDNDEDDEGDAVSVITKTNSEWSETIQNLMGTAAPSQNQKPVSPSPTSSTSSSSSVASPATSTCSKQSLMEAATAISDGKSEAAMEILTRMNSTQVANPRPSSEQRLLEFMGLALKSRVNPIDNPAPIAELFRQEHTGSTQSLYELSPCFRLGFMAANLAIVEATMTDQSATSKVHVIDFDIGQGGQYVLLFHALVARQNVRPAVVKITTVADNGGEERLRMVHQKLSQDAQRLGVRLEFNVVSQKIGDLNRESLGCEPDEPIAVNFAFKLYSMPDESVSMDNPRDELLRRVKGLAPRVVTLVEQELNTNTAPFMARVNECCAYYGALLESIEATVPRENPERVKVEEALSRKVANSVACEGRDRVERCEVFGKWRARMGMAGFELRPMGPNLIESLKNRLGSGNRVNSAFTVKEENGGVCFGWISRTLTVASAWR
ncbi:scarecrow-like protein 8 [Pyrus ussuriensis x Pyrus communis]|uniref:Scarecrow-like protein 8 n=1 Tax=Pyrus ussuriensis x Pyrus communis TaxID=2448454 RepID=A0A5N5F6N7_9ROSA|nr:scarecrow-like protein 8 [Pyrus ussuriensis x Pyrus communis]